MAMDIVDLVMPTTTSTDVAQPPCTVWTAVHSLFSDNKKTREIFLTDKFRNVKLEYRSISDYLTLQNSEADALAEVGAPISEFLITNVFKGFHERFDGVAGIALSSRCSPPSSISITSPIGNEGGASLPQHLLLGLHRQGPRPPLPDGGRTALGAGGGQPWCSLMNHNPHHGGYDMNNGRTKGYKPSGGISCAPPCLPPKTR
jgi:hypothetical protein